MLDLYGESSAKPCVGSAVSESGLARDGEKFLENAKIPTGANGRFPSSAPTRPPGKALAFARPTFGCGAVSDASRLLDRRACRRHGQNEKFRFRGKREVARSIRSFERNSSE